MPRYVSLSRAARLVGLSRGELQKLIHDNQLQSFEGQVSLDDIEKLFPEAELQRDQIIEDMEAIIEKAMKRARGEKLAKLLAPDPYTLSIRLHVLSKEYAIKCSQLNGYQKLVAELQKKLEQDTKTKQINSWLEQQLEKVINVEEPVTAIREKDNVLRVMAAQVHIKNTGHEYFVNGDTPVLEAGLSAGLALNYGCSNGNCGKCKAKLLSGEIKKVRNYDYVFTETEKLQHYFLSCCHTAVTDIVIEAEEAGSVKDIPQQHIEAKIKKIDKRNDELCFLNLKTPRTQRLRFLAGQEVTLKYKELEPLQLPIASCPCDDMNIQFHISKSDHPLVQQIFKGLKNSQTITIEGPTGDFVLDEDSDRALVFIAFDNGFAPIKSLIEHAITLEHALSIQLLWLHSSSKPYLHNQCRAWEDAIDNFRYLYQQYSPEETQQLDKQLYILFKDSIDLSDKDIYICGKENEIKVTHDYLLSHDISEEQLHIQKI